MTCTAREFVVPLDADKVRHYVIVRSDIPPGLAAAFICHAAGETGPAPPGTYAIVLAASSEDALRSLATMQRDSVLCIESEGPFSGQAMSIGFPPRPGRRNYYGYLPLFCSSSSVVERSP